VTLLAALAVKAFRVFRYEAGMSDTQVLREMNRRRVRGARMLARGEKPAQVARALAVSRQSVMRWEKALAQGGFERIAKVGRRGGRFRLSEEKLKELAKLLKQGAVSAGYATEIWTVPRVGALIQERFGEKLSTASVWRTLQRMGWSPQRPTGKARERNERTIADWKSKRWPAVKKSQRDSDESSSS